MHHCRRCLVTQCAIKKSVNSFANRSWATANFRPFSSELKRDVSAKTGSSDTPQSTSGLRPRYNERLTDWDKWIMVFTKTYPNKESIPDSVPISKVAASRDRFRVKTATLLAVLSLFACFIISVAGSRARRRGTGTKVDAFARNSVGMVQGGSNK